MTLAWQRKRSLFARMLACLYALSIASQHPLTIQRRLPNTVCMADVLRVCACGGVLV